MMADVFGELSRTALMNMLAANESKDGVEGRGEVRSTENYKTDSRPEIIISSILSYKTS